MITVAEKLEHQTRNRPEGNRLKLHCGAKAEVTGTPEAEKLTVFSKEGGIIFEYDSLTGKSRIDIPAGDLEIITRNGDIVFKSSKNIRMIASNDNDIEKAAISLDSGKISMNSPEIAVNSRKGTIHIENAQYTGKAFSGMIQDVKLKIQRIESVVVTVIEKAKNVYRTVEELAQLHTGRMRTIVDATWHFKSKKTFMKAEDDFKIKGEKIYLG